MGDPCFESIVCYDTPANEHTSRATAATRSENAGARTSTAAPTTGIEATRSSFGSRLRKWSGSSMLQKSHEPDQPRREDDREHRLNSTAKVAATDERLNRLQQHYTNVVTTFGWTPSSLLDRHEQAECGAYHDQATSGWRRWSRPRHGCGPRSAGPASWTRRSTSSGWTRWRLGCRATSRETRAERREKASMLSHPAPIRRTTSRSRVSCRAG